ncbi:Tudor domain-containing protein 5 [Bulinus truncatus]|nr:Tudor domain-containing protein 5 [Bulinus truncatus]
MITAKTAKVGMVCAAIFPEDNFWYRAVIKDIKDPYYEVLYIDYGNVCSVTLCQLRLLKAKFLKLPAQAIQARLSHCQPVGETWDVRARDRLLSLSKDKPLFGLVTDIRDRVISVCLIDTSEENKDIHINDVLCHEGYGRFVADNQPASVSTPNPFVIAHSVE